MRFCVPLLVFLISLPLAAQWLDEPDPRLQRGQDGKPILTAKPPRTPDGKPDLTGLWMRRDGPNAPKNNNELAYNLRWFMPKDAEIPMRPEAAKIYHQRAAVDGGGRPSEHCLPHGIPGAMLPPTPFKFVQAPGVTLILYETWMDYRQIFTDGRKHPKTMNPAWYGYSVGKWVGDTFEVETTGFNEESWLDGLGLPHSDQLKITERFQRVTAGHLQLEGTIDDPKMYTKPWTFKVDFNLLADADLIESVCENERDTPHSTK